MLILLYLMINNLVNRFKFTQKARIFIETDQKSEAEVSVVLDKFDLFLPFCLRVDVFLGTLREELIDD